MKLPWPSWKVLDLEWDANSPGDPLLLIGWGGDTFSPEQLDSAYGRRMLEELADPEIAKVVFTKADHRWLLAHGYKVGGTAIDVQVMAWLVDERTSLDLEYVVRRYVGEDMDKRLVRTGGKVLFRTDSGEFVPIGEAPLDQLRRYNREDQEKTGAAALVLVEELEKQGQLDRWIDMHVPYTGVLVGMEAVGLPIDTLRARLEAKKLRRDLEKRRVRLLSIAGLPAEFNLRSKDQLARYLFLREFEWETRIAPPKEDMARVRAGEWPTALPTSFEVSKVGRVYIYGHYRFAGLGLRAVAKAPKCQRGICGHLEEDQHLPSVSAKTLKVYHGGNSWVGSLLEYRLRDKALQFLDVWVEEQRGGRIYARFNQTGTATGRLSSSGPNLQQVPSRGELGPRLRALFRPPHGRVFVHADFAQIEPRLMAHFSQDPVLLDIFKRGVDIYEETTLPILGQRYSRGTPERKLVQTCFLAMGYGALVDKIRRTLAEEGFRFSRSQVKTAYDGIIDLYRVFWEWKDEAIDEGERLGYVETIAGHRRHIDWVVPDMRWKAENQTVNSKIQGSAAEIVEGTMLVVARELPQVQLVLAVHDELLGELDAEDADEGVLEAFRDAGERGHGFVLDGVKLKFEPRFITNWAEGK